MQVHDLQRKVFVKPNKQFKLQQGTYLNILNPLYGLPELGSSWIHKYKCFWNKEL